MKTLVEAVVAAILLASSTATWAASCHLTQFAELPVTMTEMRPMVAAKLNGADVRLIADSGAFFSILTRSAADDLKLKLRAAPYSLNIVGADGRPVDMRLTTVKQLSLVGAPIADVEFFVGGSELGAGSAGVLGQNLFRIADVEYDLANGLIRLMRPKDCHGATLAYWAKSEPVSAMDIEGTTPREPLTIGTALLNGRKIRVLFDSGATASTVSRAVAERAGIRLDAGGVTDGGRTGGAGARTYQTWIVPVESFALGNEEVRSTRLRVSESTFPTADMLLGVDFFLSHRIYVATSQHKLYFTYNGGPVFNLKVLRSQNADEARPDAAETAHDDVAMPPTDAAEYARRGAAFMARHDVERAIADLTKACDLAPERPEYFYQRAIAYWANKQSIPAIADLDRALTLKPDDAQSLVARGGMRFAGGDVPAALSDLNAADQLLTPDSDVRRRLAIGYHQLGLYAPEIAQYDAWLASHPEDAGRASALNNRCWARTALNRDLEGALADCSAALRLEPKSARILDSRGLVRLRLGNFKQAIEDYDAAIAINATFAWAYYGRGLAKIRLGRGDEGKSDLAAAGALDSGIAAKARKLGFVP